MTGVCTLFEGDYQHGVAVLANSLYAHGFRGNLYVGYRGRLPRWAKLNAQRPDTSWHRICPAPGLLISFIPLTTTYHLTNYKPNFMLDLFSDPAVLEDSLFYLDPDIVVTEKWNYFEDWVSCGIALCEDVNSPLTDRHPRRIGWRSFYSSYDITLKFHHSEYVNAGCLGIQRSAHGFLQQWKHLNELMGEEIGGLTVTRISGGQAFRSKGFACCFDIADQDALNATLEVSKEATSIIGKAGMGFTAGHTILAHATDSPKPWNSNYLIHALIGKPPTLAHKLFWRHARQPISSLSAISVFWGYLTSSIGSFIGRFYKRR